MNTIFQTNAAQRGITLVEVMVVVAVIGILAGLALPSYQDMIERNRLKQAAEALNSDLQWMRTESIKRSCNLNVSFNTAVWSYTIFRTAGTCTCPTGTNCDDRTGIGSAFPGITMTSASFGLGGTSTAYDFRRGTADFAGNVQFSSSNYTVKVVVAQVGRVRICNIAGSTGLPGYETC